MTDPTDLWARYLAQRARLGEGPVVLPPIPHPPADRRIGGPTDETERTAAPAAPAATAATAAAPATPADEDVTGQPKWKRGAPPIPSAGITVPTPASDLFRDDPLASKNIEELAAMVRECPRCPLCESRAHAVPGEGPSDARLIVVGEGPGAVEDETGRPFVGRAGELLTEILEAIDLPRDKVFICNVVKCRPPNNRKPQQDEIAACVPYLYRQIEVIRPTVILAMGATAAETLLKTRQSLGAFRNKVHEFRGIPVVVTYHPAALLRNPHWKKPTWDDVRIARQLVDQHR